MSQQTDACWACHHACYEDDCSCCCHDVDLDDEDWEICEACFGTGYADGVRRKRDALTSLSPVFCPDGGFPPGGSKGPE